MRVLYDGAAVNQVRWGTSPPEAARPVRFSQPASVCRVTQGGGQTPSALSDFLLL